MFSDDNDNSYHLSVLKEFFIFASKYAIWVFVYVTPIHPFIATISILLFFDLITGITKAVKKGERITSKRMRDSIIKMVFYTIAVFISFQMDVTLISETTLVFTKLIGGYIMLIEFKSNLENISEITGVDLWIALKDKITDSFTTKTNNSQPNNHTDEKL